MLVAQAIHLNDFASEQGRTTVEILTQELNLPYILNLYIISTDCLINSECKSFSYFHHTNTHIISSTLGVKGTEEYQT